MDEMKRIVIYVNGIMNQPGDAKNWTDRAVSWTHKHTEFRAEKFEYFCGVLTRRLFQAGHAQDLADMIEDYHQDDDHFKIVLVGHSNGCDLIVRALKLVNPFLEIEAVHLISAACDPDFSSNGLNDLFREGRLEHATVYVAGADLPMKIAEWTGKVLQKIGLGYGTLGRRGPVNNAHPDKVKLIERTVFGHSTWFRPDCFEELMAEIHGKKIV